MKKYIILIFFNFAVSKSYSSDAYFYADTISTAPTAFYAADSLPQRVGHKNPISTVAAVSAILAPIIFMVGLTGRGIGFDPGPIALILFLFGVVGGIMGFFVRKKLMVSKYAKYPEPENLPLGQWRSFLGIFGSLLVAGLLYVAASCG